MSKEIPLSYGSVIPCGGKGVNFREITKDAVPKPLFKVGGKELIRYSTDALDPSRVTTVVFAVDYRGDQIREWVLGASLPHRSVAISEKAGAGITGAVTSAAEKIPEETFVVCAADSVRHNLDLEAALRFHHAKGLPATIVAAYANNLFVDRILDVREDGLVTQTEKNAERFKNKPEEIGLVMAGMIILDHEALAYMDLGSAANWGGIIDPLCDAGKLAAYIDPGITYFNVGTPEEYFAAEAFLRGNQSGYNSLP